MTDAGATQDPERLREEIEQTRQEVGDTVEALAAKTDVKAQVRRKIAATRQSVGEKKDELTRRTRDASPDGASGAASQLQETAQSHPLPVAAAGAFLAGFLIGRASKG